jgi:predicted transcriptional regulator
MKRLLNRLLEKGFVKRKKSEYKPTSLRKLIHHPLYNIVEYYNSVYRGISAYYQVCTYHSPLRNLYFIMKTSCALTIALKMKLKTIRKVMKIYGPDIKVNENKVTLSFVK